MLLFERYGFHKILKVKATTERLMDKSRAHHVVAHLQSLTSVPIKYRRPTPYSFQDIAHTRFKGSRSQQGQRPTKGQP